jgi:hypothetical protein
VDSNVNEINQALVNASEGDIASARFFLQSFLNYNWVVLEQNQGWLNPPDNLEKAQFCDILATKTEGEIRCPIFLSQEDANIWFDGVAITRTINGAHLLRITPPAWFLVIQPGMEIEKILTPWEKVRLLEGEDGIEEILNEIFVAESSEPIEIKVTSDTEYLELKKSLVLLANEANNVLHLWLLEKLTTDDENYQDQDYLPLLGVEVATMVDNDFRDKLNNIVKLNTIGGHEITIHYILSNEHSMISELFFGFEPFYARTNS